MNNKFTIFMLLIVAFLILGGINIYKKIDWKEPTDGVYWANKPEGLTAVHVDPNGPAYLFGIKKGDILLVINGEQVNDKIDVIKNLWISEKTDRNVEYQIRRERQLINISFFPTQKGVNIIYLFISFIGLASLVLGTIIFVNSKKPFSPPNIFFYILCILFYSFNVFSPTGQLNSLDNIFYWLDQITFLVFPPLLLHFYFIFPIRKKIIKFKPNLFYILYFPGLLLLLSKIILQIPSLQNIEFLSIINLHQVLDKVNLLHFALFILSAFLITLQNFYRSSSLVKKRQLKWIVYGLGFGIIPFTIFYIIPFISGSIPSKAAELTIIFQALIPLTCTIAISRYRLMDFEVLLKKTVTLISSYIVIAVIYLVASSQTKIFSENKLNALILGILAIILGATLFSPLKQLFQSLLDRIFYKRSYHYRKTLVSISKELNRERNLHNLSQSLLELINNAFSLKCTALLLPLEDKKNTFYILKARGKFPSTKTRITLDEEIYDQLKKSDYLSLHSFTEKKEMHKKFEQLASFGFVHYLPLKIEDKLIGCLGMGKKQDNSLLNSEDWLLLTTISSHVALALENAYLYNQASIRAQELQKLKDYSENIIESLTVGVVVLDQKGNIIGWNRILEDTFQINKEKALNNKLANVLGDKNFRAIFPPDTQKAFRLLSEITLELPNGGRKIFDIIKTPLLDNLMNPYGTIIVFEDITEKISLQQQLHTSEKLASIGLLSAGVAHEINTPLTGISSYVQLLQKKLTDSKHTHILGKIEAQTDRVARIIKNLLSFARNPSESSFYQVNLKESLQEIVTLIDYKLKSMNIHLELNLPQVDLIWAQGERIQQVFINIILNAIDAMPEGGTLKIELSQSDNSAIIKISDTGTGIKEKHLPNIFDPFFTTKGIGKGTGLGLSISYAIIQEHKGNITVKSEYKKGSVFTVVIPRNLQYEQTNKKSTFLESKNGK